MQTFNQIRDVLAYLNVVSRFRLKWCNQVVHFYNLIELLIRVSDLVWTWSIICKIFILLFPSVELLVYSAEFSLSCLFQDIVIKFFLLDHSCHFLLNLLSRKLYWCFALILNYFFNFLTSSNCIFILKTIIWSYMLRENSLNCIISAWSFQVFFWKQPYTGKIKWTCSQRKLSH